VRVVAGAAAAEQRKIHEQAQTALRTLCMEVGVDDHAGAVAALAARRAAEAERSRSEGRLTRALDGDTRESLRERVMRLEARVRADASMRETEPPPPASVEEAERGVEEGEVAASHARARVESLSQRREDLALRFQRCEVRRGDTCRRLELAEESRLGLARRLAEARATVPDETLEAQRETRGDAVRELEGQTREAAARLADRRPEETEALARERRDSLDADERALREERETLADLRGQLTRAGQEGLFERWRAAQRERLRAERDLAQRERHASAAQHLFDTLRQERDAARSHYAAPLAEHIASLGRSLYGDDFAVELGEDLRVARRVLDGRSLLESQLSAGAREQLALLSSLAAARIAGGVPLWLDDALGHTDPERLAALGPLLAAAGESCQVIVLTCTPERFESVPGAHLVRLR
jgi:hypothetical protein